MIKPVHNELAFFELCHPLNMRMQIERCLTLFFKEIIKCLDLWQ